MQTDIGYLEELREDLLDAAWRESLPAGRRRRARGPWSRRKLVALLSAGALLLAGVTGFVAIRITGGAYRAEQLLRGAEPSTSRPGDRLGFAPTLQDTLHKEVTAPSPSPVHDYALGTPQGAAATIVGPGDLARIVKTAGLSVVVPKGTFEARFQDAAEVASRYGGFVQSSSTRGGRAGRLTIRVDAAQFDPAMRDLRALGRVEGESIRGRDVTGEYVDLHARLRIARARERVLFRLMAKATTIEQTLRVQNALDDVELRIEQIKGQLKVLNDQTGKATIDLSLREAGVPVTLTGDQVAAPSVGSAWRHAVAGFFRVVFAVIVGLGYLVPVAVVVALILLVSRRVRRRAVA